MFEINLKIIKFTIIISKHQQLILHHSTLSGSVAAEETRNVISAEHDGHIADRQLVGVVKLGHILHGGSDLGVSAVVFGGHVVEVEIGVFVPLVNVADDQVEEDVHDQHGEAKGKVIIRRGSIEDRVKVDRLVLQLHAHDVAPTVAEGSGEEEALRRKRNLRIINDELIKCNMHDS